MDGRPETFYPTARRLSHCDVDFLGHGGSSYLPMETGADLVVACISSWFLLAKGAREIVGLGGSTMGLYAFDGTWNKNKPGDAKDTNVFKFYEAYTGSKWYVEGPGTRWGLIGKVFGGLFGAGGKERVEEAYEELQKNFRKGDEVIDIVGFSRGGALALDFANTIHKMGVLGKSEPTIRFVGVWDVVPSFGVPGNDVNLGYVLTLPSSVKKCFHAMALDERRQSFKVKRIVTTVVDVNAEGRVYEVWFRGVHSDVGGGNGNNGLSSIPLSWIYKRAMSCSVPIPADELQRRRGQMKPSALVSKNFDLQEDPFRPIVWTDVAHHSVTFRPGAHNPPRGLKVVDDDGNILPRGFGE